MAFRGGNSIHRVLRNDPGLGVGVCLRGRSHLTTNLTTSLHFFERDAAGMITSISLLQK